MRALVLLVLLGVSGCSFFMSRPRSERDPGACERFGTSFAFPVVDGVLATGGIAGGATLIATAPPVEKGISTNLDRDIRIVSGVGLILLGAVHAVAVVIGVGKVRECRAAVRARAVDGASSLPPP